MIGPHNENEVISAAAARWVARRDAGLDSAAEADFERWLAADPRHPVALRSYAQTWSVLDRPVRAETKDKVLREVDRRSARRRVRRRRAAAAAVTALALIVMIRAWPTNELERTRDEVAVAGMVLRPEQQTLPDGSVVELKAGAEISTAFTSEFRRVELKRGEAHFQVARNPERPFIVSAREVAVQAVGTAFVVQLKQDTVEVVVTEGIVAVEKSPVVKAATFVADLKPLATFGAGHRLVVELAPSPNSLPPAALPMAMAEINERLAWRNPRLEFSGTPLAAAIALMNQTAVALEGEPKLRLVLDPDSPGLAAEPVSGLFRADNVEAFAHMLELSMNVRAERRGGDFILRSAR